MGISAAFDGVNYLVGVGGDANAGHNVTAQLVSASGTVVGGRTATLRTGGVPSVACDGNNYLLVWEDDATYPNDDIYGQLISKGGSRVAGAIPICTASGLQGQRGVRVAYGGARYLVVWQDARNGEANWDIYARLVNGDGTLPGSELPIATELTQQREVAVAFDGTRFLVAWLSRREGEPERWDVFGRFVSSAGVMMPAFQISQTTSTSHSPLSIAFDGSNYFVVWNRDTGLGYPNPSAWDVYARLVATDGSFPASELALATGNGDQLIPMVAYGDGHYLVMWNEGLGTANSTIKARFFTPSGGPTAAAFEPFTKQGNLLPLIGGVLYDGSRFLLVGTLGIMGTSGELTDGDVYGVFATPPASPAKPDLTVASLTHTPSVPKTSDIVTFTVVVTNAGPASASASILTLQVGGESNPTRHQIPALAAGASYTTNRQAQLSVAQAYRTIATVDADQTVDESNESNNIRNDDFVVTSTSTASSGLDIVFASDRSGNFDIWRMKGDGSGLQQLTTHANNENSPAPSPDGQTIAYVRETSGGWEVRLMSPDGSNDRLLKSFSGWFGFQAQWFPDGQAVLVNLPPECANQAYRLGLDGEVVPFLSSTVVGQGAIGHVRFSPDGSKVLFGAQVGCWSPTMELYLADYVGGAVVTNTIRRLTTNSVHDDWVAFSPDGSQITFSQGVNASGYEPPAILRVMNSDGTGPATQIASSFYTAYGEAWSPGQSILFTGQSSSSSAFDIYLINPDGSGLQQITSGGSQNWSARWLSAGATSCDGALLCEDFEDGELDSRITVETVGTFTHPPGIKPLTEFESTMAFGFGRSTCGASCFEGYETYLKITFPVAMWIDRIEFKDMELYGNWGSGGQVWYDGVLDTTFYFSRQEWNDLQPDTTYRTWSRPVNRMVREIKFRMTDITSTSEVFIDDLRIYGSATHVELQMCATLDLHGPVNQAYRIEYKTAVDATWTTLTNLTATTSPYTFVDLSSRGQPQRFYRAVPLP